jgi:hypothetical protein
VKNVFIDILHEMEIPDGRKSIYKWFFFLFKKLRFIADNKISSKSFPYFGRRNLRDKHDMT